MKKRMLVGMALGLGLAFVATTANAGSTPGSGIIGSRHDLSNATGYGAILGGAGASDTMDRICIYCHAPHNTYRGGDINYSPLWNHGVTTLTYNFYDSGAGAPIVGPHATQSTDSAYGNMDPNGELFSVSKLCLSCHDGNVALDVYGDPQMVDAANGSVGAGVMTLPADGSFEIGRDDDSDGTGDLDNHHPIGFDYDAVQAVDNEIAASTVTFASGVRIADVLSAGAMECSTCHDVHNSTGGMGEKFLWGTNAGSDFCCTCHLKCN